MKFIRVSDRKYSWWLIFLLSIPIFIVNINFGELDKNFALAGFSILDWSNIELFSDNFQGDYLQGISGDLNSIVTYLYPQIHRLFGIDLELLIHMGIYIEIVLWLFSIYYFLSALDIKYNVSR